MVPTNPVLAWVYRTFALRRGEAQRALLVTVYLGLIISCYLILKAVRDALFIDAFSAMKLPYVILGIALLAGVFVDGYIRISRRVPAPRLIVGSLVFFISNLLLFWVIAQIGARWLYPVLYIWVGLYGVAAPVQVWTLANEVFTTREAKRVFGIVGAGGITGAILGGALAGVLALKIGSEQLLLVVAGLLALCIGLVLWISRYRLAALRIQRDEVCPWSLAESVRRIRTSTHLKLLASLVLVSALTTTIVDFQFKAAAASVGFGRDQLTAFFAAALSAMSLVGLVVQLGVVRPVLRYLGLGAAILVLPTSLILGESTLIVMGGLWAAVFMKASDGAFKHSIDRSSKELAYLPVPLDIKFQVKSAIDMVLDRLGDATGGIILLVLATWLHFSIRTIGWANLALLVLWFLLALRLRRSYIDELATSIGARNATASYERGVSLLDADARAGLRRALASVDPTTVTVALELAALAPGRDIEPELTELAEKGSPEIRGRVLAVLLAQEESGVPEGLLKRLELEDQALLARALDLVLASSPEERRERAEALLGGSPPGTQGVMLALLVRRLGPEFAPVADHFLDEMAAPDAPPALRRAAACAVGLLPADTAHTSKLEPLLADPDPGVRAEAAEAAARQRRVDLAPALVTLLSGFRTRPAAQHALESFGVDALPALRGALEAGGTDPAVRERIPSVLRAIGSSQAVTLLVQCLGHEQGRVREAAIQAIERLRQEDPKNLLVPAERVDDEITAEAQRYHRLLSQLIAVASEQGPVVRFLRAQLKDELRRARGRALSLIRLRLGPKSAQAVARGLESGRKDLRDNALELIDSALPRSLRGLVVPILEEEVATAVEVHQRDSFRYPSPPPEEALDALARGAHPWLAASALRVASERRLPRAREIAAGLVVSEVRVLREEAQRIVGRPDGAGDDEEGASLTMLLVDRAVALRSVDAFRGVPTDQLTLIAAIAHERRFPAGSVVFEEGAPPDSLFVVLDGEVSLDRKGFSLGTVEAGEALGTWSLLDDEPRAARAVARRETRTLAIDREDFFELLAEHSEISRSLMRDLVGRLRELAR